MVFWRALHCSPRSTHASDRRHRGKRRTLSTPHIDTTYKTVKIIVKATCTTSIRCQMKAEYQSHVVPVSKLSAKVIEEMASIYLENYDGSSQKLFRHDLSQKDEALLLYYAEELVGFTTLKVYEVSWGGQLVRVLYSGDTIVNALHWGQQKLAFSWITRLGEIKRKSPTVPLYWFLLVKGHRTFKYLSVFGKSFFPHWEIDRIDLKPLADQLATEMFGLEYNSKTGVVEFCESRGHLKDSIAYPTPEELTKPATQFFLAQNPGYLRGHELVCVCEMELFNMKPLTARVFRRALSEEANCL